MNPATVVAIGALIAAAVAIIKGAVPGSLPSYYTLGLVAVVSAAAIGLAYASKMLVGATPFDLVAQWIQFVAVSVGVREVATVPSAGGKTLSNLPTNTGTAPTPAVPPAQL